MSRAGGLYGGLRFTNASNAPPSATEPVSELSTPAPAPAPSDTPIASTGASESTAASAPAKPAAWSAALAFAPTRRAPAKPKPRAVPAAIPASAIVAAASIVAAPVLVEETNSAPVATTTTGWGKKVKPPSMILDEDVNGFRATAGGGGKSKKSKKKKQQQQQQHAYDPFEPYDPLKPNDYSEYKRFRAQELARRAQKRGRSDESDEENEDERDRFYGSRPRHDEDPFRRVDTAPVQIDTSMTGDEAYARRLALSQGRAPPAAPAPPVPSPPPAVDADEDDDDLYVGRTGLGSEAPAFATTSASLNPHAPAFTPSHGPPSTTAFFVEGAVAPPPPFPVQMPPPPPPAFASESGDESHSSAPAPTPAAAINAEAARARAAAIAARLSKLSAPPPPPAESEASVPADPEHRPDPHGFAARLMAKWGHVAGQGIGARPEESIVVPLTVHAQQQPKGAKNDGQEIPRGPAKMGAAAKGAMGRILNKNENAGREEIARFGRPSRIVCLMEMCTRDDIEDEELRSEIGDECSKFGAVERVVPHLCQDGNVRVFVQYGGEPAAWKCVRELDGRFFGGKTVRAKYYPEGRWKAGDFEFKLD